MADTMLERCLIVFFRLAMGWTFLYAASHQVFDPAFTVVGFLGHTKTFHNLFAVFTTPAIAPITTFLVEYGHLLIGLSLVLGIMVRVSASFGVLLMLIYWMAHMDWPFVENKNNFLFDYHLVYGGVLVYLIVKRAGHVFGLDGWIEKTPFIARHPALRPLTLESWRRTMKLTGRLLTQPRRAACIAVCLSAGLSGANAQTSPTVQRGLNFAMANCARCHAIDKLSSSPLALAPPFRDLRLRYPVESLAKALGEGIATGHQNMPEFRLDPGQVGDFIEFLKSL